MHDDNMMLFIVHVFPILLKSKQTFGKSGPQCNFKMIIQDSNFNICKTLLDLTLYNKQK